MRARRAWERHARLLQWYFATAIQQHWQRWRFNSQLCAAGDASSQAFQLPLHGLARLTRLDESSLHTLNLLLQRQMHGRASRDHCAARHRPRSCTVPRRRERARQRDQDSCDGQCTRTCAVSEHPSCAERGRKADARRMSRHCWSSAPALALSLMLPSRCASVACS